MKNDPVNTEDYFHRRKLLIERKMVAQCRRSNIENEFLRLSLTRLFIIFYFGKKYIHPQNQNSSSSNIFYPHSPPSSLTSVDLFDYFVFYPRDEVDVLRSVVELKDLEIKMMKEYLDKSRTELEDRVNYLMMIINDLNLTQ